MKPFWYIVVLFVNVAAAETNNFVALDRGTAYEASWDAAKNEWVARVYITPQLDPQNKMPLSVDIRAVALGSQTAPELATLFDKPTIGPSEEYVDLMIRKATGLRAGVYQANLIFTRGVAYQTSAVQITIPVATIAGPPNLLITRIRSPDSTLAEPPLQIQEMSEKSPATLQGRQNEPFLGTEGQTDGTIAIDPGQVGAGQPTKLRYSLAGDFPLGTVSTKVTISSNQVSSPLVIPVQVRTRLWLGWLTVTILIGLILGYLLRSVLKPRVDLGEARQRAIETNGTLAKLASSPDATFRAAITIALTNLRGVIESPSTVAQLAAAIAAAEAARQAATTDLESRLRTAKDDAKQFSDAVTPWWKLPPDASTLLDDARNSMADIATRLRRGDAAGAQSILADTVARLRVTLASYRIPGGVT